MSKSEHYVYVSNKDLTFNHFVIDLPTTIHLEGNWKCALLECSIRFFSKDVPNIPKCIYILSDFCTTSFVNNAQRPVLRKVIPSSRKAFTSFTASTRMYIPMKQDWLNKLEFSVRDENLDDVPVDANTRIEFTLHLKRY